MGQTNIKYTEQVVLKAIKGSGAIISTVSKRLGVEWHTAKNLCNTWDSTKQALLNESEGTVDMAEGVLLESIQNKDVQSAKWYLSTIGKKRGYSERQEITGADGSDLQVTYKIVKPTVKDGNDNPSK